MKHLFLVFHRKKDFLEIPPYTTKFNSSGTLSNSGKFNNEKCYFCHFLLSKCVYFIKPGPEIAYFYSANGLEV